MMRHYHPIVPAALLILLSTATTTLAQPPGRPGPSALPIAGAPPDGDYLPPTPPSTQNAAALRIFAIVAVALTAIMLMLRFFVKHDPRLASEPDPSDDLVRRAQAALDKAEEETLDAQE